MFVETRRGAQHALLAGGGVAPALSPSSSAAARERFGTRCLAYAAPSIAPQRALSTSGSGAGEAPAVSELPGTSCRWPQDQALPRFHCRSLPVRRGRMVDDRDGGQT